MFTYEGIAHRVIWLEIGNITTPYLKKFVSNDDNTETHLKKAWPYRRLKI